MGGDRVKSMANFHNVREVSLINAIGCEGFEKNTHWPPPPPPHTLPGIRQNGLDPKAEVYSEPFKTSKMEIFIITVTVNYIFKELW